MSSEDESTAGPSAKWVGYELHDGLLQWLVGAHMQLEAKLDTASQATGSRTVSCGGLPSDGVHGVLRGTLGSLSAAIDEGRALITFLEQHAERPGVNVYEATAEFLELMPVIDAQGKSIEYHFDQHGESAVLTPEISWNVLRIIQQAARNAYIHSGASEVFISITRQAASRLCISIRDNGRGFDVESTISSIARQNHFGLASMQHRARHLGGELKIESSTGRGCRVTFCCSAKPSSETN